jgi:RNA polymerase sigma factor (sigma-70 family)
MAATTLRDVLRHLCQIWEAQGETPDSELLERYLSRKDDRAFAALVRRHGPLVLGVGRRVLDDAHAAEDVFQATFLVLVRRAASVSKHRPLAGWLFGVAQRIALKARARAASRRHHERRLLAMPRSESLDEHSWQELRAVLDEEIAGLPQKYQACVVLCHLQGLSYDQAAKQLGWSKSSLAKRVCKARELLRGRLVKRGVALSAATFATLLTEQAKAVPVAAMLTIHTVKAAMSFAAGKAAAGSGLSAAAVVLAEQTLRTMVPAGVKMALLAVALSTAVAGAGVAGYGAWGEGAGWHALKGREELGQSGVARPFQSVASHRSLPRQIPSAQPQAALDADKLDGHWLLVEHEQEGKIESRFNGLRLIIKGDDVIQLSLGGDWSDMGKLKVDAAKSPKQMTITWSNYLSQHTSRSVKEVTDIGIYAIVNGKLKVCTASSAMGERFPTDFKSKEGDHTDTRTYQRLETDPGAALGFVKVRNDWVKAKKEFDNASLKANTAEERRKAMTELQPKPEAFATRNLKLVEQHPDSSLALSALCWAASNAPASESGKKALAMLADGRLKNVELDDLMEALKGTGEKHGTLAPLTLDAVKQKLDQPRAAEVLNWICGNYWGHNSAEVPATFAETADLIETRFAASPEIRTFCEVLSSGPTWAGKFEKHLLAILDKNNDRGVRIMGLFAQASLAESAGAARQEEAMKLYQQFVATFKDPPTDRYVHLLTGVLLPKAKVFGERIELLGLGKTAPELVGEDLDGNAMKLSDFRGKVTMVSFWATWCGPCMRMVPHERALV